MSDERTNEELAEIAHYGISRYCDECPLVACGPGDDCHAALDELTRRANEAVVYKRALEIASRCIVGHCSPDTLIDMARKELGL